MDATFDFNILDMANLRRWWCKVLMENLGIEGHGKRFAHYSEDGECMGDGVVEPLVRVSKRVRVTEEDREIEGCHSGITGILEDGDPGILNLALTCQRFNRIVCQPLFLQEAHFAWLDSVVNWNRLPPDTERYIASPTQSLSAVP